MHGLRGKTVTAEATQVKDVETGPTGLVSLRKMAGRKMHMDQYKPALIPEAEGLGEGILN